MKKVKASKGFITAASTLMLAGVALTGFYITETIVKQEALKSINEVAQSTAKKLYKVQLALQTFLDLNRSINLIGATQITCNTLVQQHLLTSKDCYDAYGNPIIITTNLNTGTMQVSLDLNRTPNDSIFGQIAGDVKAIYQADTLQHYIAMTSDIPGWGNNWQPPTWGNNWPLPYMPIPHGPGPFFGSLGRHPGVSGMPQIYGNGNSNGNGNGLPQWIPGMNNWRW